MTLFLEKKIDRKIDAKFEVPLSFTRAHSEGLGKIMPFIANIEITEKNHLWHSKLRALQAGIPY